MSSTNPNPILCVAYGAKSRRATPLISNERSRVARAELRRGDHQHRKAQDVRVRGPLEL